MAAHDAAILPIFSIDHPGDQYAKVHDAPSSTEPATGARPVPPDFADGNRALPAAERLCDPSPFPRRERLVGRGAGSREPSFHRSGLFHLKKFGYLAKGR